MREHPRQPVIVASGSGSAPVLFESGYPPPAALVSSDSHAALRSALYAGIVAGVLSFIPLGPTFVFALPLAGFLCILLYRRWTSDSEPPPRAGFRLGALAGLFGFVAFIVLTAIGTLAFHAQLELRDAMLQAVRQAQARNPDPQARQMLDYFMTPQGLVFMMVFGFIFMCIIFVLLSGLGGAVSATLLRRKGPPEH